MGSVLPLVLAWRPPRTRVNGSAIHVIVKQFLGHINLNNKLHRRDRRSTMARVRFLDRLDRQLGTTTTMIRCKPSGGSGRFATRACRRFGSVTGPRVEAALLLASVGLSAIPPPSPCSQRPLKPPALLVFDAHRAYSVCALGRYDTHCDIATCGSGTR
jgi:hypothetical protein